MKESHFRSVTKAISWRILGSVSTIAISFVITQKIDLALSIGLVEFFGKIGLFYFHERLWGIIPLGLIKT